MGWNTPITWVVGQLVDETNLNQQIRDDLNYLKAPVTDLVNVNEASNYTTTSTTFVDVDSAGDPDLQLTVTTTGGDILIGFQGNVSQSVSAATMFDIALDGVRQGGDDGLVAILNALSAAPGTPFAFTFWIRSVSASSHTVKLQWKTSAGTATLYAGAGTANGDLHPQMWLREVT